MMWLADHSLRVLALVLVVGTGSLLAYRSSAHSRLFAWTVVLFVAMAMPLFSAVLPSMTMPVSFANPVIVVSSAASTTAENVAQPSAARAVQTLGSGFPWLLALYVVGASMLLARMLAGLLLTRRMMRGAQPIDDPALTEELHQFSRTMGLSHGARTLQHAEVHVPFVCGVWRPVLVLPGSWPSWDRATRQAVLAHELSHIARRDLWTIRAASLYQALTWMNPISWWLRRKLETLAERASDDAVLAAGVEPTTYAELLVRFFEEAQHTPGRANWQLAMARRGYEAQRRVGRVLNAREGGNVRFGISGRVCVGMAVTLAAVPVMVVSAAQPELIDIRAALPAPSRVELPIVVVPPRQEAQQVTRELPPVPVAVTQSTQQQEEPEPWRSTRKATDAGVVEPVATVNVIPRYTADAMRAKIQGAVAIEIIVSPEGHVTDARVLKSLDRIFGLDDEALLAARQWKFLPGTFQGQPTALRAMLTLEFRLH